MIKAAAVISAAQQFAQPEKAIFYPRFFKAGKGEYAQGDRFVGITVPNSRKIARQFSGINISQISKLLQSKIHEYRLIALLILVDKYQQGSEKIKEDVFNFYISNTRYINNWDLVDLSADKIVGAYLLNKNRQLLTRLAHSQALWEKRIAIIATYRFIKVQKEFTDTFTIAQILLHDKHDLIHKAVGWMLREVGKHVSQKTEETFLLKNYKDMPRTMLRYAIEHFPEPKRQAYLRGTI